VSFERIFGWKVVYSSEVTF